VIVWLNGAFGAGKTATSRELAALLPEARVFDAEQVGHLLHHVLAPVRPVDDFQRWRPWRELVVATAGRLLDYVGGTLVVPQTVLREDYWTEIRDGLAAAAVPVRPFVLHCDRAELVRRIEGDVAEAGARQWRPRPPGPLRGRPALAAARGGGRRHDGHAGSRGGPARRRAARRPAGRSTRRGRLPA
jgi:hypothetical protein